MNCEQIIRNSESVNELICTGYSPHTGVWAAALRACDSNVHVGPRQRDQSYSQRKTLHKRLE